MKHVHKSSLLLVVSVVSLILAAFIQLVCCQDASATATLKHQHTATATTAGGTILQQPQPEILANLGKETPHEVKTTKPPGNIRQQLKHLKYQLNSSKISAKEKKKPPTLVTPPLPGDNDAVVVKATSEVDHSLLDEVTDLEDLPADIKDNLLQKKSNAQTPQQQSHAANLTPPSSLKTPPEESGAKMASVAGAAEEALPVETSSETAKVLETMTSTTPPQEPPKVIETTSTDSFLNLTQTQPSPLKQEPLAKMVESLTTAPKEEEEATTVKPAKTELPSDIKILKFEEDKKPVEPAVVVQVPSSTAEVKLAASTEASPPSSKEEPPAVVEVTKEEPAKPEATADAAAATPQPKQEEPAKAAPEVLVPAQEPPEPVQEEPVKPVQEDVKPTEAVALETPPQIEPKPAEEPEIKEAEPPTTQAPQPAAIDKPLETSEASATPAAVIAEPATTVVEVMTNQPEAASTTEARKDSTPEPAVHLNEAWHNETTTSPAEVNLKKEEDPAAATAVASDATADSSTFIDSRLVIDTNDYRPNESRPRPQLTRNPDLDKATKFCTDMAPLRDLFADHIEPLYMPVVGMMPESLQALLLDQTSVGGLRTASCGLLVAVFFTLLVSCLLIARRGDFAQIAAMNQLNETVIVLDNMLKKAQFEKQSFESQLRDLEVKHVIVEEQLNIKEEQLQQIQMDRAQKDNSATLSAKELEKLKSSEAKLQRELKSAMLELNQLHMQLEQEKKEFEVKLAQADGEGSERMATLAAQLQEAQLNLNENRQYVFNQNIELEQLRYSEAELTKKLEEKERALEMLQSCLVKEQKQLTMTNGNHHKENEDESPSNGESNGVSLDDLMKSAELKMKIKHLENELETERANLQAKSLEMGNLENKLREHDLGVEKLKKRQQEVEKLLKEQEMQVKLLNELREKDTKQHLKSYAELDAQLKKKSSDADKATHLLDQLRVKQERIQELESQFARIEKQSTLERQTFEKQAHENWLSARKFEKELKESKNEIAALKERLTEFEQQFSNNNNKFLNENTLIRPIAAKHHHQQQYYMSPVQQQQVAAAAKKSSESSPKAPSLNADNDQAAAANLASTSSIGLDAAPPVADLPLQIDTATTAAANHLPPPSSGSLHERPASVSSNPGNQGYPPNAAPTGALMYNPYVRSQYAARMAPFAPAAFMSDQRSSPDVMASAAGVANPAAAFYNQVPRMPMPHPAQVYRMYQQQQQYLQQQQQQQQQQQYQLNSSSSQQGSPRAGSASQQPLSSQSNQHIPFSNSFNGSLNGDESTAHLNNTADASLQQNNNNDHDLSLQVNNNNEPSLNDSQQRGNSLNV